MVSKVSIGVRLHVDEVNHTIDGLFETNWDMDWESLLTEAVVN